MDSIRFSEHRAVTYLASLQVLIIIAGTLLTLAATKLWDDNPMWELPNGIRFVRSTGLGFLVLPLAWLAGTIVRSERSRFRIEPLLWKLAGIALLIALILIFTMCVLFPFMPTIVGPLMAE